MEMQVASPFFYASKMENPAYIIGQKNQEREQNI